MICDKVRSLANYNGKDNDWGLWLVTWIWQCRFCDMIIFKNYKKKEDIICLKYFRTLECINFENEISF